MATAWVILSGASFLVALVAVLGFKRFSDTRKISTARNRLIARFVELFLYQESLRSFGRASGRLFVSLFSYLLALFVPLLAAVVLVVPILFLISPILSKAPLLENQPFLLEISKIDKGFDFALGGEGVRITSPPVRIPEEQRIVWKAVAIESDSHFYLSGSGSEEFRFPVAVGDGFQWVTESWSSHPLAGMVPGVAGISLEKAGFGLLEIEYPERNYLIFRWKTDWLTALTLVTVAFSIPLAILARITV